MSANSRHAESWRSQEARSVAGTEQEAVGTAVGTVQARWVDMEEVTVHRMEGWGEAMDSGQRGTEVMGGWEGAPPPHPLAISSLTRACTRTCTAHAHFAHTRTHVRGNAHTSSLSRSSSPSPFQRRPAHVQPANSTLYPLTYLRFC
jgi:hypothetical protein